MSVCTKERKGVTAEVLMATPCTNSLGGESRRSTRYRRWPRRRKAPWRHSRRVTARTLGGAGAGLVGGGLHGGTLGVLQHAL